ncbi:MAG TPA: xanthine dehydrogenase family protein subunit M [Anaerolineales bacterium]|nr:xanthine dehydrogenase family protein subunit M [Anaerolineales bacterium]
MDWQNYLQPEGVEEALAALQSANGEARLVAGGTDLLLDIQQGRQPAVETLVDVTGIPELTTLTIEDGFAKIGAAVPLAEIADHRVLQERATALTEACGLIGGPQVRNVATLGGNVAHALPAADGTIALMALDAQAELASSGGREWVPLARLFAGPGSTSFDRRRHILVSFRLALSGLREGSAFVRVMRPQGVAIAILNMACWIRLAADGSIEAVRLSCGPSGPTPRRCPQAEKALLGSSIQEIDWPGVTAAMLEDASFRTSPHRATKEYRRHLSGVVLKRVVTVALDRAGQALEAG